MKEKTIVDIVLTLTREECKQHLDLINECIKRENDNENHASQTAENLKKLTEISYKIQGDFEHILNSANEINLTLIKTDGRIH